MKIISGIDGYETMRKLIFVPIIHMSADLGSIAQAASKKGESLLGEELWSKHHSTIQGDWTALGNFFKDIKAVNLKIFQDGMLAQGEAARQIVKEAVEKGSENYRIISELMDGGAELMLTEDYQLAKRERDLLVGLSDNVGTVKRIGAYLKYKLQKKSLLKKRDKFIAARIDKTLGEKETGILFIGASHSILPILPKDIHVIPIKDQKRVSEYQKSILKAAVSGVKLSGLETLSNYLTELISIDHESF